MKNHIADSDGSERGASPLAVAAKGVTRLLENIRSGNTVSWNEFYAAVHAELRALAAHKLASERPGHTLQATALVNEAYLRLSGTAGKGWENRAHFFAAAAEAMRRILVDSARRKQQHKRGGKQEQVELRESQIIAPAPDEKLLLVHEALDALTREDSLKAEIVKLRYFVGLKHQEIADALGINEKTVRRHWEVAKVRLYELISGRPASPEANPPDAP